MTLVPGTKLGPYELELRLGAGGMGEVYRARDTRLDRKVAVKILPAHLSESAEARQRFDREARTISSLSHPNVCQLYDVGSQAGTHFLVMEYLEGETLSDYLRKGMLPLESILKYGIEICEGLAKAHKHGIIHRDLKPANIFLTHDGHIKLLDFGLARGFAASSGTLSGEANTLATEMNLTSPGVTLGTIAYMSPEQARGEAIDERSDLFSLGTVLYEIGAGRRAFEGATSAVIFDAILNRQPKPATELNPQLPFAFGSLLNRLMAKHASERCQSAREVVESLREMELARQSSSGKVRTGRKIPSIAVLPFSNLSPDPENQYFSDGLAEELTNALSRLHGLRVASRTSAFRFRGGDVDIREIGRMLNVEAVVEGSVRRSGKRLRITAQLVNVADGYHMWSERYDREITDLFEIQDEITESILKMLEPALAGQQSRLTRRHSENLQAYELYVKGLRLLEQRGESALRAGLECFRTAVELDPEYALAYAGIADSYSILSVYGYVSLKETRPRAFAAIHKALELDPTLGEVHYSMGNATAILGERVSDALGHFGRALDIQPRSSYFHAYLCLVLAGLNRAEEAAAEAARATELDPLSPFIHGLTALSLNVANRQQEAVRNAQRALELHPNFVLGLWSLHKAKSALGLWDESIAIAEKLASIARRGATFVGQLGLAYGLSGQKEKARALREELQMRRESGEYITPAALLAIDIGLEDAEASRHDLLAYIEDGGNGFGNIVMLGPFFYRLNAYPGCVEVLQKAGFPKTPTSQW